MYIPKHFAEHDQAEILRFIAANAFGTLVTVDAGVPFASHIPFLLEQGDTLTLSGHLAKANPQWQQIRRCWQSSKVHTPTFHPHGTKAQAYPLGTTRLCMSTARCVSFTIRHGCKRRWNASVITMKAIPQRLDSQLPRQNAGSHRRL